MSGIAKNACLIYTKVGRKVLIVKGNSVFFMNIFFHLIERVIHTALRHESSFTVLWRCFLYVLHIWTISWLSTGHAARPSFWRPIFFLKASRTRRLRFAIGFFNGHRMTVGADARENFVKGRISAGRKP